MTLQRRSLVRRTAAAPTGGSLYFASEKEHIQFIRSGCTMLDCALGGGWAAGKVSNIVGDKSTGKTQLAMEAMGSLFKWYPKDGECFYDEAEAAFDDPYARAMSIPIDRVEQLARQDKYTRSIEAWAVRIEKIIEQRLKANKKGVALHITDSLDSFSDEAELAREFTDEAYGGKKAARLAEFFRKMVDGLREANLHLMVISQIRDVIGAQAFGKKTKRSGGHALDFYCSQVVWLTHVARLHRTVKGLKRVTGIEVKAQIEKNKIAMPFREAQYELTFAYGIEDEKASRAFLESLKVRHADLHGEQLRAAVMREWFEIEKSFLPERAPKYG